MLAVVLAVGWCSHDRRTADGRAPRPETSDTAGDADAVPASGSGSNEPASRPVGTATGRRELARAAFRRAQLCYFAKMDVESDRSRIAACESVTPLNSRENYAGCQADLASLPRHLAQAEASLAECQRHEADLDGAYFRSTRVAAAMGEPDAQMCYLVGAFGERNFDTRDLEEFKSRVPLYITAALRRGDWRVVQQLGSTGSYHTFDPIEHALPRTPAVIYRMNRLLRLGATGDYAEGLDHLAAVDRTLHDGQLPPAQAEQAEAWARQTYRRYFVASPPLSGAPIACEAQR